MNLESQKFAESDMLQRLLQQSKTKAQQLIEAVQKAIEMDGKLLSPNELRQIEEGLSALLKAKESDNRTSITDATDQLEKATADFAHRRVAKHLQDQID